MSLRAPVGAVAAFGGRLSGIRIDELRSQGWLPCDGAAYAIEDAQYADLFRVIRKSFGGDDTTFRVPDLRGQFIRGTDRGRGQDPNASERSPAAAGGNAGDAVGSSQGHATGRPRTPFRTSSDGDHAHVAPHLPADGTDVSHTIFEPPEAVAWTGDSSWTDAGGGHSHQVTGGDDESRPANIYLHWIIKFRPDTASAGAIQGDSA